jgi:hypothetical protein
MALIVSPVIVKVRFISVGGAAAIIVLLLEHSLILYPIDRRPVAAVPMRNNRGSVPGNQCCNGDTLAAPRLCFVL